MSGNITHEAVLERFDDEELAKLVKERESEPTIRVSAEDLSWADETNPKGS